MSCIPGSKSNKARVGERGKLFIQVVEFVSLRSASPLRSVEKSISRRNIARKGRPSLNIFPGKYPRSWESPYLFFFFFCCRWNDPFSDSQTNYSRAASKRRSFDARNNSTIRRGKSTDVRVCVDVKIILLTRYEPSEFTSIVKRERRLRSCCQENLWELFVTNERKNNWGVLSLGINEASRRVRTSLNRYLWGLLLEKNTKPRKWLIFMTMKRRKLQK